MLKSQYHLCHHPLTKDGVLTCQDPLKCVPRIIQCIKNGLRSAARRVEKNKDFIGLGLLLLIQPRTLLTFLVAISYCSARVHVQVLLPNQEFILYVYNGIWE